MLTLREVVIFLAGASAFHTFSHLALPAMVQMPLAVKWPKMTLTTTWNTFAIVVNVAMTVALIVWATRL